MTQPDPTANPTYPPAQPSYPPQAYPPQQGYPQPGYPQQGYPQQGQPWQQGAPQYPPMAPPQPRPPSGNGRTLLFVGIGAAVLVLLAGIGVAVVVSRIGGNGPGPGGRSTGGELSVAWKLDYPGAYNPDDRDTERLHASWLVDDTLIRASSDGVIAYKVADGAQAWGLPVPQGKSVCTASLTQDAGLAAIAYGAPGACDTLAGVDLHTGKQTFEAKLPPSRSSAPSRKRAPLVSVVDGGVVAFWEDTVTAFDLKDGRKRWDRQADNRCYMSEKMAANKGTVLLSVRCLPDNHLVAVDAANGKTRWDTKLDSSALIYTLFSADPAIIETSEDELITYDAKGAKAATIPQKAEGVTLNTSSTDLSIGGGQSRYAMSLVGNVLYAPTREARSGRVDSEVLAYDVTNGKLLWASSGHTDAGFTVIRADEKGVLGFEEGGYDVKPRIVQVAADTGKASTVTEWKATGYRAMPFSADYYEKDKTLFILPVEQGRETPAIQALR
jgi:outer membrane protein assembly factor BamB